MFECEISADVFREATTFFFENIDSGTDTIRIYNIGKNYRQKLITIGLQNTVITDTYVF